MLKFIKTFTFYLFLFLLTGCFDSSTDKIVDDYEVAWIDVHEQRALYKQEQLVPAYVFAVGHDTRFIYAKQHPQVIKSAQKIDTSITNYYVIERTKNEFQDKPTYGPLTKSGFDSLCMKLEIKNAEFNITYTTNLE